MSGFAQYYLTCANKAEADKIADNLLDRRLIVCAKHLPVTAKYWWNDAKEAAEEVLLVMESSISLFDKIESAVAGIHSYETFVLECVPIGRLNAAAEQWINENLT